MRKVSPLTVTKRINALKEELKDLEGYENKSSSFSFNLGQDKEALRPSYKEYVHQVVKNCKALSDEFIRLGYKVVTGGTDNHLILLDLSDEPFSGRVLQEECDKIGITLNKNCVPCEKRSPRETSGVRIGTAPMTTRGYLEEDFVRVVHRIDELIKKLREEYK